MNVARKSNKTIIASIVMALLIALSMMPGMAFADSDTGATTVEIDGVSYTTTVTVNSPGTVLAGGTAAMPAVTTETTYTGATHVDWSLTNGTGSATINKHKGQLTAVSAGTVYVTATLRTGEAASGGGAQSVCPGTVLDTYTYDLTIDHSTAYGFQGTGGNTMKMLTPSNIMAGVLDTNGYTNVIEDALTLTNGSCNFTFTMSAGMNNFDENKFKANSLPHIQVIDDWDDIVAGTSVTFASHNAADQSITLTVSGLAAEKTYILKFGEKVCGNNTAKNLGVPVTFQFTTAK